jgi:hypothetical protein
MRTLAACLALPLVFLTPGCVLVLVEGDLEDQILGEEGGFADFPELRRALDGCVVDPDYDLRVSATPWHQEVEWTVSFCDTSDGPAAFGKAREAVLARLEREGGTLTGEAEESPHVWSCTFRLDDEPGEASVRLVEERQCPHRLLVVWEEDD